MEQILRKINYVIKKYGIVGYRKKWKPPQKILDEINDYLKESGGDLDGYVCEFLSQYVQTYHHHSFVDCPWKPTYYDLESHAIDQEEEEKMRKGPKWARDLEGRPKPDFFWDSSQKIGRIRFYRFWGDLHSDGIYCSAVHIDQMIDQKLNIWQSRGMRGLILDFSRHQGGNMWPTIYSLRRYLTGVPFFGWTRSSADAKKTPFFELGECSGQMISVYQCMKESKGRGRNIRFKIPIAVIVGPHTASSGELLAAIFAGKKNSRIFGSQTAGMLSANSQREIGNGATLYLTEFLTVRTDGDVREYLTPDVKTSAPVREATKWIVSTN